MTPRIVGAPTGSAATALSRRGAVLAALVAVTSVGFVGALSLAAFLRRDEEVGVERPVYDGDGDAASSVRDPAPARPPGPADAGSLAAPLGPHAANDAASRVGARNATAAAGEVAHAVRRLVSPCFVELIRYDASLGGRIRVTVDEDGRVKLLEDGALARCVAQRAETYPLRIAAPENSVLQATLLLNGVEGEVVVETAAFAPVAP